MDKYELRRRYKVIRLSMRADDVASKSQRICQNLLQAVDLTKVNSLNIYKPIAKLNEVDCSYFVNETQKLHPQIQIDYTSELKTDTPPSQKFDIIIVPVLAFDKDNNRLGWGGGWYDKFLAAQPGALKIGLCFQNGLVAEGIKTESYDIPLDKVVTEL